MVRLRSVVREFRIGTVSSGAQVGAALENLRDHLLAVAPANVASAVSVSAVCEHGDRQILHVVGHYIAAIVARTRAQRVSASAPRMEEPTWISFVMSVVKLRPGERCIR